MSVALHVGMLGLPSGTLAPQSGGRADATGRNNVLTVVPAARLVRIPSKARATDEPSLSPIARGESGAATVPEVGSGYDANGFGIPGPRYYAPGEVSRRARAINDISSLPPDLEQTRDSGRMVLVLRISAAGSVDDVLIDQSDLPMNAASELATQFRQLRFHPAEIDGVAVNSRMKVEVILNRPTS